jgi:hypothetical protein
VTDWIPFAATVAALILLAVALTLALMDASRAVDRTLDDSHWLDDQPHETGVTVVVLAAHRDRRRK